MPGSSGSQQLCLGEDCPEGGGTRRPCSAQTLSLPVVGTQRVWKEGEEGRCLPVLSLCCCSGALVQRDLCVTASGPDSVTP